MKKNFVLLCVLAIFTGLSLAGSNSKPQEKTEEKKETNEILLENPKKNKKLKSHKNSDTGSSVYSEDWSELDSASSYKKSTNGNDSLKTGLKWSAVGAGAMGLLWFVKHLSNEKKRAADELEDLKNQINILSQQPTSTGPIISEPAQTTIFTKENLEVAIQTTKILIEGIQSLGSLFGGSKSSTHKPYTPSFYYKFDPKTKKIITIDGWQKIRDLMDQRKK